MVSYDELAEMEMYDEIMQLGLGRVTTELPPLDCKWNEAGDT